MTETRFDPAGTIALFIASALQHPDSRCNGNSPRVSTISEHYVGWLRDDGIWTRAGTAMWTPTKWARIRRRR